MVSMFFALMLSIATETEAAARPLRIAYLLTSGTMASLWIAKETGGFAKEGFDVEFISMSSTLALPALLANEVDVIQISAAPLINASLRGFRRCFRRGTTQHDDLGDETTGTGYFFSLRSNAAP
jgi:ABC-type nitrate/sulfonate/bicarbonate transport system substrate-binding protein